MSQMGADHCNRATHMYEAVSGKGTWRSDTNASAFVLHMEGDSFRFEDGATRSTRILSAVSRSWATQLCTRIVRACCTMVGEPKCYSYQCRNCKAITG